MIGIYIQGGLGNMMFQIAFIESLARKYDLQAGYDNVDSNIRDQNRMGRLKGVDIYRIFRNIDLHTTAKFKRRENISHLFADVVPIDGTLYVGYAVSEKNFYSEEFIWNLFEPVKEYPRLNCTSVHVRRTDYVNNPGYAQLGVDYYKKALEWVDGDALVFTDDLLWCRKHFQGFEIRKGPEPDDLFTMASCDNNIIANSTFSWWGAYLNQNENKIVIAPRQWVGDGRCKTEDIVPDKWRKICIHR